eukprot:11053098-Lingulodinium_polyedra.AAC.1
MPSAEKRRRKPFLFSGAWGSPWHCEACGLQCAAKQGLLSHRRSGAHVERVALRARLAGEAVP